MVFDVLIFVVLTISPIFCFVGWPLLYLVFTKTFGKVNVIFLDENVLIFFLQAALDLGTCPHGYGFGGTGKKSNNRQVSLG